MIILRKERAGCYVTLDGQFTIEYVDDYETECQDPHPMRVIEGSLQASDAPWDAKRTTKRTKAGWVNYLSWHCPGGERHWYARWIVIDNEIDDYPWWTGPDGFDTRAGAAAALEHHLKLGTAVRRES